MEGRGGHAEALEEGLFPEAVLGPLEGLRRGVEGKPPFQAPRRLHGDVLKLVGDEGKPLGEAQKGPFVQKLPHHELPHLPGAGLGGRVQEAEGKPQGVAGKGQHPPELPPAQDPDHASSLGSGWARTASVWALR